MQERPPLTASSAAKAPLDSRAMAALDLGATRGAAAAVSLRRTATGAPPLLALAMLLKSLLRPPMTVLPWLLDADPMPTTQEEMRAEAATAMSVYFYICPKSTSTQLRPYTVHCIDEKPR